MSSSEPSGEPFDSPYWNILQVIAWVYVRDRTLVVDMAEGSPLGFFSEDVRGPDDVLLDRLVAADQHDTVFIEMSATQKGGSVVASLDLAIDQIWHALQSELLEGFGTRNGVGDLTKIQSHEWASLKFDHETNRAIPTIRRPEATVWYDLRFSQSQVLAIWLDPSSSIRTRQAIWEAPEALTDSALEGWARLDSWTVLEAMFVVHGCAPRNAANADDEIFTHFVRAHSYLARARQFGTIGRMVTVNGRSEWMDTPANWIDWAASKGLPIDDRLASLFPPRSIGASERGEREPNESGRPPEHDDESVPPYQSGTPPAEITSRNSHKEHDLVDAFDPLPLSGIAKMFRLEKSDAGNTSTWRGLATQATKNKLAGSRISVGGGKRESTFKPYLVGEWLVDTGKLTRKDVDRCLVTNLPPGSHWAKDYLE